MRQDTPVTGRLESEQAGQADDAEYAAQLERQNRPGSWRKGSKLDSLVRGKRRADRGEEAEKRQEAGLTVQSRQVV